MQKPLDEYYQGNTLKINNVYDDDDDSNDKDDDDDIIIIQSVKYHSQGLKHSCFAIWRTRLQISANTHDIVTDIRVSPQLLHYNNAV